jgi:lipopolysaccharide transport system ATP-binding protein
MKKAEIARKFDEIVAFAEVERFIDTPVKRYSSGMYVRLAFAVAAHLDPEILVLDEVLAVGDAQFQKKCLGKMSKVAEEGRTVLFVSHNMGAVSSLCNRGLFLLDGHIQSAGAIDAVIDQYVDATKCLNQDGDLSKHPLRTRGFAPLLTSFDLDGNKGTVFHGCPVTLRIGYQFSRKISVPQFCVSFLNERGIVAFTLISDYQPNNIPSSLLGRGWVECRIASLPLLPGVYTVSVKLWQPGQKLDEIENVTSVTVEWTNRKIGQFKWDSSLGVVYVDATWSTVDCDAGCAD